MIKGKIKDRIILAYNLNRKELSMNKEIFESLKIWFDNYTKQFSFANPNEQENIDLKYKHSYEVCKFIIKIAKSLPLNKSQLYTAKVIALFHDLGRFEQYAKYKTFSDTKSEDHAKLGVKILKENEVLALVNDTTAQIILKAISYHNKVQLPTDESEECLFYTKLIRDADKLDIWRVVLENYNSKSRNKTVGLGLADTTEISTNVYNQVMNREVVRYENLKSLNDFKLIQIGWVYDINFQKSFEIIKDKQYIEQLFKTLPNSKKLADLHCRINAYLGEKLGEQI
ncbi:HD domain-containing protein [Orenia metallireducens]|nr:HD domain-containing protein [Orenia metallireducens]